MRTRLLLMFTVVFFSSCWGVKTKLSAEDLTWLIYESGDTIIFSSSIGELDTFSIFKKELYYSDYKPNGFLGEYKPQVARILYSSARMNIYGNNEFDIVNITKITPDLLDKSFNINDARFSIERNFNDLITELNSPVRVNNMNFSDVFKVTRRIDYYDSDTTKYTYVPKTIYWSKEHGLIKYITYSGDVWELSYRTYKSK